ncbi:polysaccharide deacetylase family protein [Mucilaginibacter sp. AW1-7]|uniref:polysaccharide deacetylase family protein n=1 Tax=unclassified Mucilaginibacter TaxID=2617802 RepID=UPI0023669952|nr:polysaccharide deacetylase family protein [Mucilaginibacter sp. KACC 22773]WDF77955.1 polysaccharide deacetylase family protein [Mucilaginibacter sp. KACC 22773]
MLTFRNTNIAFLILLGVTIWADKTYGVSWLAYGAIIFIYSLIVAYGCYFVSSGFFMPMYCSAKTTDKVIAITFDDGPVSEGTPQVLQILKDASVEAAFFCIGERIAGNEAIIRQMDASGHIIGNHSYTHAALFDLFPSKKMLAEMQQLDNELDKVIGKKTKLFRPPYGVMNPNLKNAIIKGGYLPIGWSVRSYDTMSTDADVLLQKVTLQMKPGAIFLFHDRCPVTVAMLPNFLGEVRAKGYRVVRVDKMLGLPAYQ